MGNSSRRISNLAKTPHDEKLQKLFEVSLLFHVYRHTHAQNIKTNLRNILFTFRDYANMNC